MNAAQEKIQNIRNQAKYLHPKTIIPFASFIRFSNVNNCYLNDCANTPREVLSELEGGEFDILILRPHEQQDVNKLGQDAESLLFWDDVYKNQENKELFEYQSVESMVELNESFRAYRKRIFSNNSYLIIYLLNKLRILKTFREVTITLNDLKENVVVDLLSEDLSQTKKEPDISLHSASLDFLFRNTFGFDTLTVNGCFEESEPGGFSKATKLFAVENLNNIGIYVKASLIYRLDIVLLFLRLLSKVMSKLR